MNYGFIKVAAATPRVHLADPESNLHCAVQMLEKAESLGVNLLVFPELYLTGYTCGDLFYADLLLGGAKQALLTFASETEGKNCLCIIGLPIRYMGKLYNCAAAVQDGRILGVSPKVCLPNYGEFYDKRQFTSGEDLPEDAELELGGEAVPFGTDLLYRCAELEDFIVGAEICEDLWAPVNPATDLALSGATVIANLSTSDELIGKDAYRRMLVTSTSSRLICGYIYANSGYGESTQDMVFSGHCMIAENGSLLAERKPFASDDGLLVTELDIFRLRHERHNNTTFPASEGLCRMVTFHQKRKATALTRFFPRNPFVPNDDAELSQRAEEILQIQSQGLMRRFEHTHSKRLVVGISGGLDSTLALLVMVRALDLMGRPRTDAVAVTMPCFGTTKRTKSNAMVLCEELGVTLMEVPIGESVNLHFRDIGHDPGKLDVTFENCQARERTQVLMDLSNELNGIVVGTGDLSELALGWATYNGDHMSMYAVNTSVPKTLVRYIIRYEAGNCQGKLRSVLEDILDTPVSPELLPADDKGEISQKTEDLVGPYELHDFFLYHMLRTGAEPGRIFHLAKYVFTGVYSDETILRWLREFTRRFFQQQFKRSCLPDGPKVGTVTLSPRGDWRMPSDALSNLWLKQIDELKK